MIQSLLSDIVYGYAPNEIVYSTARLTPIRLYIEACCMLYDGYGKSPPTMNIAMSSALRLVLVSC